MHEDHSHEPPYEVQLKEQPAGTMAVLLFGNLFVRRSAGGSFCFVGQSLVRILSQEVGLMATLTLLVSSFFVYRGETAMEFGDRKRFQRNFMVAAFFGFLFLGWSCFF